MLYFDRYICQQGDVLDEICFRHYGTEHGTTEIVLAANYDLTQYGTHLPIGLLLIMPPLQATPVQVAQTTRLWE